MKPPRNIWPQVRLVFSCWGRTVKEGLSRLLPATLYGFPVEGEELSTAAGRRTQGKRGIALLIAIMVIAVMMLFTSDLILSSQVDLALATTHRDNLKAEYMAKSAFNVAIMLTSADFAYDLFMLQQNPKGDLVDGNGDFWSALNGFPIGGGTVEMMASFQEAFDLNQVLDSEILAGLKQFDGAFVLNVEDEQKKININYCHMGRCTEVLLALEALMSCPAERVFLERKNIDPKELTYKIKDWIDEDKRAETASGFSDESDPYERREPRVKPKNAPLDSLDELRMIDGWDEEVHAVFAPYLTVYPFQAQRTDKYQINLNTASRALLHCIFPEAKGDCTERSTFATHQRDLEKLNLVGAGENVADVLRQVLCYSGGDGNEGEASYRANWFSKRSSTFRIEAKGMVGGSEKTLTVVITRVMPDPKKKETSSYKVLHWKMI